MQYVPPELHDITIHKTILFIVTVVRTSDLVDNQFGIVESSRDNHIFTYIQIFIVVIRNIQMSFLHN
jgi:hypothetical protein